MTVKSFLNTFLHASSTIEEVIIYYNFEFKTILNTATLDYSIDSEEYIITIGHFSINGNRIVIYCI